VADPMSDGVCYGLQDLVMAPAVVPLAQGSRTAAEDVLQGSSFRHRGQGGDSTFPQNNKLDGLGRTL